MRARWTGRPFAGVARLLLGLAVLVVAAAALAQEPGGQNPPPVPDPGESLLPDLDQALPRELNVKSVEGRRGRFQLGFESAVDNVGRGPLEVVGRRAAREQAMVATQLVHRQDGSRIPRPNVGRIRYTRSADHDHWHLLRFDRYELRRATDFSRVRADRKTGFCLGDRYETDPAQRLPAEPEQAAWTGSCGQGRPRLRRVREGISVGFGDNYPPHLEGQYLDVTGLSPGEYFLVHRVNADGRLLESDYGNNAAAVRIELRAPAGARGRPAIRVLRRCPDTDRC